MLDDRDPLTQEPGVDAATRILDVVDVQAIDTHELWSRA
jgi:hypothetical protein